MHTNSSPNPVFSTSWSPPSAGCWFDHDQLEATIFLSDSRVCTQDKTSRIYKTLREPFFDLIAFNGETLAGNASIRHAIIDNSRILLIPWLATSNVIQPGSARDKRSRSTKSTTPITPTRPTRLLISSILTKRSWSITYGIKIASSISDQTCNFDIDGNFDRQVSIFPDVHIGNFQPGTATFSRRLVPVFLFFAIEGAFEVQDRSLHPRDGLALTNVDEGRIRSVVERSDLVIKYFY